MHTFRERIPVVFFFFVPLVPAARVIRHFLLRPFSPFLITLLWLLTLSKFPGAERGIPRQRRGISPCCLNEKLPRICLHAALAESIFLEKFVTRELVLRLCALFPQIFIILNATSLLVWELAERGRKRKEKETFKKWIFFFFFSFERETQWRLSRKSKRVADNRKFQSREFFTRWWRVTRAGSNAIVETRGGETRVKICARKARESVNDELGKVF